MKADVGGLDFSITYLSKPLDKSKLTPLIFEATSFH